MVVLAGASASGKTEVAKLLAKKYGINKIITTTTRDIRTNEIDGRDYFFVTKETFEEMIHEGKFVEYTLYNGKLYGSTIDQVADNKCVVIDPAGLRSYTKLKKDHLIITFFLDCDESTRKERMVLRGDDPEKIESRIAHDRKAFKKTNVGKVDFVIDSSSKRTIEMVTDEIYSLYLKEIKK